MEKNNLEYHLKENDVLYFLHIQKTAGTSLTLILESQFDYDEVYHQPSYKEMLKDFPRDFSKYRLFRGHYEYWFVKLLPKKPIIMTMLRKPLDHIMSYYAQEIDIVKEGRPSPLVKNPNDTLEEIFKRPKSVSEIHNHQIRNFTRDIDISSLYQALENKKDDRNILKDCFPYLITNSQTELLALAKQRISQFTFIGLAEKFDESLFLLYYTFGWFPTKTIPKINVREGKRKFDELSNEVKDKLQNLTREDEQLYQFAQHLFQNRYEHMVQDLKEKYYEPQFENLPFHEIMYKMLEKHYYDFNKNKEFTPSSEINYDFGQKYIGEGWFKAEKLSNEEIIRWSGPSTISTLYFLLKKRDLYIKIEISSFITENILKSLKLKVNGYNIPLKLNRKMGKQASFEGIILHSSIKNEKLFSILTFEVKETISPQSLDDSSKDPRKLGLAFRKIIIKPKVSKWKSYFNLIRNSSLNSDYNKGLHL